MWDPDEFGRRSRAVRKARAEGATPLFFSAKGKKTAESGEPSRKFHIVAALVLAAALAGAVAFLAWRGVRLAKLALFTANDRFTITRLHIQDESPVVLDFLRSRKIFEGTNLFSFDIAKLRQEFLKLAPGYRSIRITRRLPDVLSVDLTPRVPLARVVFGWRDSLVTDKEGVVFPVGGYTRYLPAVVGYRDTAVEPGQSLKGMAVAALQLVEVCDNPVLGIQVEEVDVSREEHLDVKARYAGQLRRVQLSWEGMGTRTTEARLGLLRKLGWWVQVMQTADGMGKVNFDGTYPDKIFAF